MYYIVLWSEAKMLVFNSGYVKPLFYIAFMFNFDQVYHLTEVKALILSYLNKFPFV